MSFSANPQGGPGHAEVELSLRDGRTLRRRVTAAKGDPAKAKAVLDAVAGCDPVRAVVVVGFGADLVVKTLQEDPGQIPLEFVEQRAGHRHRGRHPHRHPSRRSATSGAGPRRRGPARRRPG